MIVDISKINNIEMKPHEDNVHAEEMKNLNIIRKSRSQKFSFLLFVWFRICSYKKLNGGMQSYIKQHDLWIIKITSNFGRQFNLVSFDT